VAIKRGILVSGSGEQFNGAVASGQADGQRQANLHCFLQRRLVAFGKVP